MSKPSQTEIDKLRTTLRVRAAVLRAETAEVDDARSEAIEVARDAVEDAGDEAEMRRNDEVRGAEEQRDLTELGAVDAALARIEAGTYGVCLDCGVDIPRARLQAQPAAARCIACQERAEQAAAGPG
ncbi:MAG: TraR/DksA family transcriptional regulator [Burkholderiaceae bacterium]